MNDEERAQAAALTETVLRKQAAPYTQLPNKIVQAIRNPDALAIWAYLNSKSSNWRIIRGHLTDHFGLGRDRYTAAMRVLRDAGLVSDQYVRDGTRIVGRELYVHLEPYIQVSVDTENVSDGKPVGYYETQDNSTKEKSSTKPPNPRKRGRVNVPKPAIGGERYTPAFELVWAAWPKGKGGSKQKAFESWVKKGAEAHADMLLADVVSRAAKDRGWRGGYAPHMSTYLNGHHWTADIDESENHEKTNFEQSAEASERGRNIITQIAARNFAEEAGF